MKFSSTLSLHSKLNGDGLLILRCKSFTPPPQERALLPLVQIAVFALGPIWTGVEDLFLTAFRTPNTLAPSV